MHLTCPSIVCALPRELNKYGNARTAWFGHSSHEARHEEYGHDNVHDLLEGTPVISLRQSRAAIQRGTVGRCTAAQLADQRSFRPHRFT